ncbi:uncharacterized protein [Ptychodera flava]|uniref:uncharacterized protein isoform X2 n=1 Tax=Ptychodera flava TaxID=63121 RepID=UPI003969F6D9
MNVPRVKRDRRKRGPAQLPWQDSNWVQSFAGDAPSPLKVTDLNPGFALRQIVLLLEKRKFNDCSQLINQLNQITLKTITPEMPIDMFISEIPSSLIVLESLFSKLFIADPDNFPVMTLKVETLLLRIVQYMARQEDPHNPNYHRVGSSLKAITSILRIIAYVDPELMKVLKNKKTMMENVVEGMGDHGLVSLDSSLMTLHDALKLEFEKNIVAYKAALVKLEELSLSHPKPMTIRNISTASARIAAPSHHKLMKINQDQIQVRLYKNKALLNVVEPSMRSELPKLLENLQQCIENDKSALLTFGQLRKEIKTLPQDVRVAPVIAQYLRGLNKVLELFDQVSEERPTMVSGNTNGYLSDEDAVIALEGSYSDNVNGNANKENGSTTSVPQPPEKTYSDAGDSAIGKSDTDVDVVDVGPSRRSRSKDARKKQERDRSRGRSKDKSRGRSKDRRGGGSMDREEIKPTITKPRRNSVEESAELKLMIARINRMAAASGHRSRSRSRSRDRSELHLPPRKHYKSAKEWLWADLYTFTGDEDIHRDGSTDSQSNASMEINSVGGSEGRMYKPGQEKQLMEEIGRLKYELAKSLDTIQLLQQREMQLMSKLSEQNQKHSGKSEKHPITLIHAYTKLYTDARQDALDALDELSDLEQFDDTDDIKTKLLFSVIVLSFRCCQVEVEELLSNLIQAARVPNTGGAIHSNPHSQYVKEMEHTTMRYLYKTSQTYDTTIIVEKVCSHLFNTLHDYPSLRMSSSLKSYIATCVRVAWQLSTHTPSYIIDYDSKEFSHALHQRFHRDDSSKKIKCYLWPALLDASTMKCVHKGVVITEKNESEEYGDTKL